MLQNNPFWQPAEVVLPGFVNGSSTLSKNKRHHCHVKHYSVIRQCNMDHGRGPVMPISLATNSDCTMIATDFVSRSGPNYEFDKIKIERRKRISSFHSFESSQTDLPGHFRLLLWFCPLRVAHTLFNKVIFSLNFYCRPRARSFAWLSKKWQNDRRVLSSCAVCEYYAVTAFILYSLYCILLHRLCIIFFCSCATAAGGDLI